MTLGRRDAGQDDKHFNRPTDIAWLPDDGFWSATATSTRAW